MLFSNIFQNEWARNSCCILSLGKNSLWLHLLFLVYLTCGCWFKMFYVYFFLFTINLWLCMLKQHSTINNCHNMLPTTRTRLSTQKTCVYFVRNFKTPWIKRQYIWHEISIPISYWNGFFIFHGPSHGNEIWNSFGQKFQINTCVKSVKKYL